MWWLVRLIAAVMASSIAIGTSWSQSQTPDLSHLLSDEQSMIRYTCSGYKNVGPARYYKCLQDQVAGLSRSSGPLDLSHLPSDEQSMIRYACSGYEWVGPARYSKCLQDQVASLGYPDRTVPRSITPKREHQPAKPSIPRQRESTDPNLYQVQWQLRSFGYDPGPVDGRYGPRTRGAIEAFQRDHGLRKDGKIDRSLVRSLQIAVREKEDTRETPRPSAAEPRIAVAPRFQSPPWHHVPTELPSAKSGPGLSAAEVYEAVKNTVWVIVAGRDANDFKEARNLSQGSAIAVSPQHLLTNCHVLKDRSLTAIVQGEEVKEASLTAADPSSDRCILKVDKPNLLSAQGVRRYTNLKVGERVYTVGAPSGLERTLGEGIISGLRASSEGQFIQMTAPISPGSSGGGLFDRSGNLIGVTTFPLKEAQALNFAIAAEDFWH